jgi:hypothetical protein
MSRRHAAKIAVFLGFCQYFGLDMVYFVAISLHMMWYNTQTQTIYVIKDRKQENKEKTEMVTFSKTLWKL